MTTPSLLGQLVAGAAAGGATAQLQANEEQHKADIQAQLLKQKAGIEEEYTKRLEERRIQQQANMRQAMAAQINPATEAILNAQGKTGIPSAPAVTPTPTTPDVGGGLLTTGQTPGAPSTTHTDYATQANSLLAPPSVIPVTHVAASKSLQPASLYDQIAAQTLALVQAGRISDPDKYLEAAVKMADTSQTSAMRLENAKILSEANILALRGKGAESAQIRADNPADQGYHNVVALGRQRDSARLAMQHEQNLAANAFNKDEKAQHLRNAESYKQDMQNYDQQISKALNGDNTGSGQAPDFSGFKIVQ